MNYSFFKIPSAIVVIIIAVHLIGCQKHQEPVVTISGFTPNWGYVGDAVTINGNNFSTTPGNNKVSFIGGGLDIPTNVTSATSTSLNTTVPQGAIHGAIKVTVNNSTDFHNYFEVLYPPQIINAEPASGPMGTLVKIIGTDLVTFFAPYDDPQKNDDDLAKIVVKFNGIQAEISTYSSNSLLINGSLQDFLLAGIPQGATSGKITVTLKNGMAATSATDFVVTP